MWTKGKMAEDWNLGWKIGREISELGKFSTVTKSIEETLAQGVFVEAFAAAFQLFVLW